MKKLLSVLFSFAIMLSFPYAIKAEVSTSSTVAAETVMTEFINQSSKGDKSWEGLEISNSDVLFDTSLEQYGYIFELSSKDNKVGYGIVINSNNRFVVVEASKDNASPYRDYATNKKVYTGAFGYFVNLESKNAKGSITLKNIKTGETVDADSISIKKISVELSNTNTRSWTGTTYMSRYSNSTFEFISQRPTYTKGCIPTSFAMALRFLHNVGKLTINYSGTNRDMMVSIYTTMDSSYGTVDDQEALKIQNWTSNRSNCSKTVTTRSDTYYPTYSEFINVQNQINNGIPVLILFNEYVINNSVKHATTMVGYQVIDIGGAANYVIVVDPWQNTKTETTILWSTSNIHAYLPVIIN